jgi:nucleoside-diphosphate-sugar epimerase
MKKRVLITGIGGSIGIHMFDHIMLNTDWDVVGIDSYRHKGFFDRLAQTLGRNPGWEKRLVSVTHDLTAPLTHGQLKKIGHVDYIINLASLADVWDSVDDPVPFVRNNMELMLTMLELARAVKPTPRVVQSRTVQPLLSL